MRIFIAAAMAVLLAGPAFAQQNIGIPLSREQAPVSEEERQKKESADKAYKSATEKMPAQNSSTRDPWGNVRAVAPPLNKQGKPRSGAK